MIRNLKQLRQDLEEARSKLSYWESEVERLQKNVFRYEDICSRGTVPDAHTKLHQLMGELQYAYRNKDEAEKKCVTLQQELEKEE